MKQTWRETRLVQRGPKAISGTGKVMSRCAGIKPGINSTEQHAQVGHDDISYRFVLRGEQVSACRLRRIQ
jgi:hypothetical protein